MIYMYAHTYESLAMQIKAKCGDIFGHIFMIYGSIYAGNAPHEIVVLIKCAGVLVLHSMLRIEFKGTYKPKGLCQFKVKNV